MTDIVPLKYYDKFTFTGDSILSYDISRSTITAIRSQGVAAIFYTASCPTGTFINICGKYNAYNKRSYLIQQRLATKIQESYERKCGG